jgi:hypothetical protein
MARVLSQGNLDVRKRAHLRRRRHNVEQRLLPKLAVNLVKDERDARALIRHAAARSTRNSITTNQS